MVNSAARFQYPNFFLEKRCFVGEFSERLYSAGTRETAYYQAVRKLRNRLNIDLLAGKYPGQPTEVDIREDENDGHEIKTSKYVYLTSKLNIEKNVTAGATFVMTLNHAARLLASGTHEVSTEEQIEAMRRQQREQKAFHDQKDAEMQLAKGNVSVAQLLLMQQQMAQPKGRQDRVPAIAIPSSTKEQSAA